MRERYKKKDPTNLPETWGAEGKKPFLPCGSQIKMQRSFRCHGSSQRGVKAGSHRESSSETQ